MNAEMLVLWTGIVIYTLAGSLAIAGVLLRRRPEAAVLALIVLGLAVHGAAIGLRWERLGHGPFVTMFEILSSNVWSLTAIFALAYWRLPQVRPMAAVVMPVLFVMMAWLALENPRDTQLPPTYHTSLLYIHVGLGKVFLGSVLRAIEFPMYFKALLEEAKKPKDAVIRPPGSAPEKSKVVPPKPAKTGP